ncbi:MAG: chlorite dismutase [Actinobacteria bacterium]|nr:chlorite dismutase [Actinomycetota bacterium]MED5276659.1 chlorite dismutase family protein [Actinomycetota bacterium]|tara:strand:+ start:12526 stop:13206 length:681 start_codon:yes stop_codon:yes gene_type:complete
MNLPVKPSEGLGVLHLFCKYQSEVDSVKVKKTVTDFLDKGLQVVVVVILGHKADLAIMVLGEDLWDLRDFQSSIDSAGLKVVDSYLSLTEVSEYASGVPEEMKQARLYPELPPENKIAWCFYPMSKRRDPEANWYTLPYDERSAQMHEHGRSGRNFAGRVLQVVTGSTGVDDYEWGVTLFAERPDDLKEVVYTMRFDEASAIYAEFGPFYTGMVSNIDTALEHLEN